MPPVAQVELGRDHVARAPLGALLGAHVDARVSARVQSPCRVDPVEVDDVADVVEQGDVDVQA